MRLADTGTVYVTLRAALSYHSAIVAIEKARGVEHVEDVDDGSDSPRGLEQSRLELTEIMLDARRSEGQDRGDRESWRVRGGDVPLSAEVVRDGQLAIVVTVHPRRQP